MKAVLSTRSDMKRRILYRLCITIVTSVFIFIFSLYAPPGVGTFDKVGMEIAVIALAVFLCRFPVSLYLLVNLFVISAAAGSILRVYDMLTFYDRIVHFISGILLGYIGLYLTNLVSGQLKLKSDPFIAIMLACFFSCTCAGFWEIIEFSTDCFSGMSVQHGNTDTMGDIVAGFLGALVFKIFELIKCRKHFTKDWFKAVLCRDNIVSSVKEFKS